VRFFVSEPGSSTSTSGPFKKYFELANIVPALVISPKLNSVSSIVSFSPIWEGKEPKGALFPYLL
jgi:hypothetical protein